MGDTTRTGDTTMSRSQGPLALLLVVALAAAGCAGSALGYDRAPASLDPAGPKLGAIGVAFDRAELAVPANRSFILVFENREAVSHNVSIYTDDSRQERRFEGVLFGGPATRWYPVPALAPGTYVFLCDLHPSMTGRLVAA
jgi:plastocyanin